MISIVISLKNMKSVQRGNEQRINMIFMGIWLKNTKRDIREYKAIKLRDGYRKKEL